MKFMKDLSFIHTKNNIVCCCNKEDMVVVFVYAIFNSPMCELKERRKDTHGKPLAYPRDGQGTSTWVHPSSHEHFHHCYYSQPLHHHPQAASQLMSCCCCCTRVRGEERERVWRYVRGQLKRATRHQRTILL